MATPDKVERSLRLLDDLANEGPRSKLPKLSQTINPADRTAKLSDSFTFSDVRLRRNILADLSMSLLVAPGEITGILDGSVTGRVQPPDKASLCRDFKDILSSSGTTFQVFDAINGFIEVLEGAVRLSRGVDAEVLASERDTWSLLLALYRDRASAPPDDVDDAPADEKEMVEWLYRHDSSVRECQIIVDWLESLEARKEGPSVAHFTDKTVGWENTLHELQNGTALIESTRPLVSSLDPDAPHREKRALHDLDADDDKRLLSEAFRSIRAGKLDAAQAACLHCGQAWRAAAIDGWRLFHDPNRKKTPGFGATPPEGNARRDIWKRCAWAACETVGDPFGQAMLGALCGHLKSLKAVCREWPDSLWAHLKVSLDVSVERCLRESCNKPRDSLPEKYWNGYMELDEIFCRLRATPEISSEATSPLRALQEALSLDDAAAAVAAAGQFTSHNKSDDLAVARFAAHIVLILRLLGCPIPADAANEVVKNYVRVLVVEGDPELAAFYAAMLSDEDQVDEYANLLVNISDDSAKKRCVDIAVTEGLNAVGITQRTVQLLWQKAQEEVDDETMAKETSGADVMRVNALEWLMILQEQRGDALIETNCVMRNFVLAGKLDAARAAYSKIPSDSLQLLSQQYTNDGVESLPLKLENAVKEYLCHKAYLDAQEGFSDWFKLLHMRPVSSAQLPRNDIASTVQDSRLREQMDAWKTALARVTRTAQRQLLNVLLFPGSGWMVDVAEDDTRREREMAAMRQHCIPEIISLLHTLLHRSELYTECLGLCTVVMSEKRALYKVFSKQALRDFMEKMAQSSLALSDNMPYDFGIPPPPQSRKPLKFE